jgi:3-hydroxyisobutyrate dehydrogenase-like beta-hydroxyacid dehydrogenase
MQSNTPLRIGLIGLGLMGHGIGRNLLKNGFALTVMGNVNRVPVDSLVSLGAYESKSVAQLVGASDVVMLCVTGSPQVESLMNREQGILQSIRPGQIVIDCSTSQPSSSAIINARLLKAGALFVDAPLGRTPTEAEAGKLNVMVGATPQVLEHIRPVLQAFCENIIHVGEVISAQKLKLINNFAIVGTAALLTEALRACDHVGVSRQAMYDLMSKGPLQSGLLQATVGEILNDNYAGMKFSVSNACKDIGYFNNLLDVTEAKNSLASSVLKVLVNAVEQDLGGSYLPSLVKAIE